MASFAISFPLFSEETAVALTAELTGFCPCCQKEEVTTYDTSNPWSLEEAKTKLVQRHENRRSRRRHHCRTLMIFS